MPRVHFATECDFDVDVRGLKLCITIECGLDLLTYVVGIDAGLDLDIVRHSLDTMKLANVGLGSTALKVPVDFTAENDPPRERPAAATCQS